MDAELRARIAEISRQIRHYPTPIARCDDQLSGLIEERSRLIAELNESEEHGPCSPLALWINDGGFNAA
jgi:hypothetical protein